MREALGGPKRQKGFNSKCFRRLLLCLPCCILGCRRADGLRLSYGITPSGNFAARNLCKTPGLGGGQIAVTAEPQSPNGGAQAVLKEEYFQTSRRDPYAEAGQSIIKKEGILPTLGATQIVDNGLGEFHCGLKSGN